MSDNEVDRIKSDVFLCADIDECSSDYSHCHEQATCSNQVESFSCDCNTGFTGNGFHCDGKRAIFISIGYLVSREDTMGIIWAFCAL